MLAYSFAEPRNKATPEGVCTFGGVYVPCIVCGNRHLACKYILSWKYVLACQMRVTVSDSGLLLWDIFFCVN